MNVRDPGPEDAYLQRFAVEEVISLLTQPACVLSHSGRIEFYNSSFAIASELDPASVQGFDFSSLLDSADRKNFDQFVTTAHRRSGATASLDVRFQSANEGQRRATLAPLEGNLQSLGLLCQIAPDTSAEDPMLRYVRDHIDLGVWDYDTRSDQFIVSSAWRNMRGLSSDAQINVPNDGWLEAVHPDDRAELQKVFRGQADGNVKSIVIQYRHRHLLGHWVWILCRASVMEVGADGRPLKIVGTDTDITSIKNKEEDMFELTGKLQLAIEASGMGIWEFDPCTSQVHWDDRMLEIYGITDGKYVRSDELWETHIHPSDLAETVAYAEECQKTNADFRRDYRIVRPNGAVRHIRSLARSVAAPNRQSKLIGVNIDVTDDYLRAQELEEARRQLEHDSRHDALTGLGNRRKADEVTLKFFDQISSDHRYVAMHIDLDHFKRVNDTLGHSAGDFVLENVAEKLNQINGVDAHVFRVGGDEFTILFENAPRSHELETLCRALIDALSEPTKYQGQDCSIGASIGYAIGQGPPKNPSDIFIQADTALYSAKHAGRSCFREYSEALEIKVGHVANARQDLIDAFDRSEFECLFQSQFDARTLDIVGAEALVRWRCPNRGLLTPDKFLAQAEQAGLLSDLDAHVLQLVTDQQSEWAKLGIDYPRISLNTSMTRLQSDDLISQMRDTLEDHHRISLELLETAFLDTIDTSLAFKLDALRELGVHIELDDFGSGRSSVAALQAIKPNRVHIDRCLIAPLSTKPNQLLTLRSLVEIARLEGAGILVEGLETGLELAAIRDLDCDALQGYALHRPVSADAFAASLQASPRPSRTAV